MKFLFFSLFFFLFMELPVAISNEIYTRYEPASRTLGRSAISNVRFEFQRAFNDWSTRVSRSSRVALSQSHLTLKRTCFALCFDSDRQWIFHHFRQEILPRIFPLLKISIRCWILCWLRFLISFLRNDRRILLYSKYVYKSKLVLFRRNISLLNFYYKFSF